MLVFPGMVIFPEDCLDSGPVDNSDVSFQWVEVSRAGRIEGLRCPMSVIPLADQFLFK